MDSQDAVTRGFEVVLRYGLRDPLVVHRLQTSRTATGTTSDAPSPHARCPLCLRKDERMVDGYCWRCTARRATEEKNDL